MRVSVSLPLPIVGGACSSPGVLLDRLSVITPYVAELGFFLDINRLRVQGTHILPALQNALTLWSVHITSVSEPDHGHAREQTQTQTLASNLLSQTQTQFASALSTVDAEPDPVVYLQVVQTGILLAYYMQRIGQVVGARYYASGTWALGMMLKLHQGHHLSIGAGEEDRVSWGRAVRETLTAGNMNVFTFAACANWAQPLDESEAEERVRAFWAVYALDRWFSAVCGGSRQSLATDAGNAITVPWPSVGGTSQVSRLLTFPWITSDTIFQAGSNAVQHFLNDPSHDFAQEGVAAMHAKATVLLGEATAIAASYVAGTPPSSYLVLSYPISCSHQLILVCSRPCNWSIARVSSAFRDIGCTASTVPERSGGDAN